MSVYEIEKTIERLGDALRNPETTKLYEAASNYNPAATKNDGSCLFPIAGCTYAAATNYVSKAIGLLLIASPFARP